MHLYSVCALFLLALVACQAAPSPKVIEKSINEAETTFDKNAILEETSADKGRAKKSATTFCVAVNSGKPEQVPCRGQEVRQDIAKPLVILQPIPIPGPGYSKPIPPPPQPSPSISLKQQQQSAQVVVPPPAPVPAPAPVQTPAPAPTPIINIIPQAPAPVPCDKPQQPQQPQQPIHMVHVIQPQPQPPQRPSVMVIQPPQQEKPVPKPQNILPSPPIQFNVLPQRPTCRTCNGFIPPQPLNFLVQPRPFVQPTALYDVLPRQIESDGCNNQEESYECNCRAENRIPTLRSSRFLNGPQEPRAMTYHDGAPFESPMPYRSSQMSTENNPSMMPSMMSDQPIFFPSEQTHRGMEARHKKQYPPVNLSVQFPIVYPGSGNSPKYYEPVYQTSYTNPSPTYAYPTSYQVYGNYGNPYPAGYGSQASPSVPAITVNTAGPFYRESQQVDSLSQSNEMEMLPGEAHSTATEMIDAPNNQKREVDVTQLKSEHEEIAQTEK
ncbi:uncharacterized protein [Temnothorax longispinosus]|uniref:uncharacterized protein isoform X1 n=1 Tax=Temnothorax longispinosus TaxID=300112 RepID=UPI003A99AC87